MSSQWAAAHRTAAAALAKQKWSKALRAVAPWLRADEPRLETGDWTDALTTLAAAASRFGESVQAAAQRAAAAPEDGLALHGLGYALVEAERSDLAVAVLLRAVEQLPEDPAILAELAAALELQGRNREVVHALDQATGLVEADPLLAYLRAFNAFMVADLETPQRLLPSLLAADDERFQFMAGRIQRMLARAQAAQQLGRLQPDDLRGWHFVLTAGLLLRSERLGKIWDSAARVKDGVSRLVSVCEAWQLAVPAVLFPPERNSETTARVAAQLLGCQAHAWHGGDEPGLLVVYDARAIIPELRDAMVNHRPGQPLFMHAAEHTTEQRTAADLLTFMYASNTSPWGPGLSPDNQPIDTTNIPIDSLVDSVIESADDDSEAADRDDLTSFASSLRDLAADAAPGALRAAGQRERLWVGSPVAK